ncbi:hypothetical protein [Rhizobium sp. 768_B6_N1_8]|uniref:hypothetical protein n=1 Tax=unclassified Rhizobium TaxID=2613769 RepID=UPI003F2143BB
MTSNEQRGLDAAVAWTFTDSTGCEHITMDERQAKQWVTAGASVVALIPHTTLSPRKVCDNAEALTRPIIGIENRTAQEVFAIMCDRIRLADIPSPSPQLVVTVPCPCTLIEQDEDCPVGYPSLLCGVCKGQGHTTPEQVTALACEMIKIASDVGEPDDPFAAWESISLLQSQNKNPAPADHVVGTEERGIGIGMAIAAGIIMRVWGQEVYAHEILTTAGFTTLDELKASGVDQFDIDALTPIFAASATEGSGDA